MSETKKPTVSAGQIADFLEQTGFVFEMRANEAFLKARYATEINDEFLDLEKDTIREIDIVATKVINEINVHFVVECKQSLTDKWIFICTKDVPRYYRAVKHLPIVSLDVLTEKKLFSDFHVFSRRTLIGHNYLCYTIKGDKKTEHLQIDECVHKLPKALIDLASRAEGGRHLFFPVALFAGQIFAVSYRDKLLVKELSFLEHYVSFEKETYLREPARETGMLSSLVPALAEIEQWAADNRQKKIRKAAGALAFPYQIDFVTENGLRDYLAMIEKQVAAIRTADWPIPGPLKSDTAEKL